MTATLSVREVVRLYLQHSKATGLHCQQSLAEREHVLKLFVEHLKDMSVEDCKAFHLSDWIEAHEEWKSTSTKRGKSSMVKAAFQWAADGERIDRNPFRRVRYAEAERRPDLPDDCLERLEHLANKKYELVLRFLRLTGCRIGEVCGAVWADVDLDRGVWTIPKHKSRKHTGKAKLIALVPDACSLLVTMARTSTPSPSTQVAPTGETVFAQLPVFTNNRGTKWNDIALGQHLNRMKRRHGLTFRASLHGIRHRFGSAAIAAGAPIKLVSQQMGHSSVKTTEMFYCDLSGEMDSIRSAVQLGLPKKQA